MQSVNRDTDLISEAYRLLKDAESRGVETLDVLSKSSFLIKIKPEILYSLGDSSSTISKTMDKYVLNEHLINTSRDLITQYERKAKYEKLIIVTLLVIFFAVTLNIVKERLLW